MEAQANTTREQSNKKRLEVGDPRMEQIEEQEKNTKKAQKGGIKYVVKSYN